MLALPARRWLSLAAKVAHLPTATDKNLPADLDKWLVAHLDRPLLPVFQVIWGKPNKWQPPGDQGEG